MRTLLVRWRDTYFDFEAKDAERDCEDYIVETIGLEIARDELFVSLAHEILPDDRGYRAVTHVALRVILEEIVLHDGMEPRLESISGIPAS